MYRKKYEFFNDGNNNDKDSTIVSPVDLYTLEKGYGFVVEENRRKDELLQLAELNSSFQPIYWFQGEKLTFIDSDTKGCYVNKKEEALLKLECDKNSDIPLIFKAVVPKQGNYTVTICIENSEENLENLMIFTGRRRLAYRGTILKNSKFEQSFTVNVCDIIPRGKENAYEDKTIDVAICGSNPRITSIIINAVENDDDSTKTSVPTLYIAGDSTVTDQGADYPYNPGASYCGWGQMLSVYLKNGVAVSNHAHSGLTTESFRSEGHYNIVKNNIKPGDYYFLQFAHNDQKLEHLKAEEGYKENVIQYMKEIRELGAFPVIVTPIARNSWKGMDGSYNDLLEGYAAVCKEIGQQLEVPVVDLHDRSMEFVKALGLEKAKSYFFPTDFTHSNDYGGYIMAGFVAEEFKKLCSANWAQEYKVLADLFDIQKEKWIPSDIIQIPKPPKNYVGVKNPDAPKGLFEDLERPEDVITRAEALDMVIKTVRFFPTNVYNDMFEDVIGHEWFAGTIECAYQNGLILPEFVDTGKFYPDKQVTMEEFICICMNGYKSRKQLPEIKTSDQDSQTEPWSRDLVRAANSLELIGHDADLKALLLRKDAAEICIKMNI